MKKIVSICALVLAVTSLTFGQSYCSDPGFRQLDFAVGKWDVLKNDGSKLGDHTIDFALGTCAIKETYTTTGGYEVISYNTYNKATGEWMQTRIDNGGNTFHFTGKVEGDQLIYRGEGLDMRGEKAHYKLTYFKDEKKIIRQRWEASPDLVKWITIFDGEFKRKPFPKKDKKSDE